MKKSIIAFVALGFGAACANAQEQESGHGVAVFTSEPAPAASTGVARFTLGRQYNLESPLRPDVGDLRYFSNRARGLSSDASWTVDSTGRDRSNRAWGISVGADFGAFSLRAAHQNLNAGQFRVYDLAGHTMEAKNSLIAANYRMDWGTAYAAYSVNRGWGNSPLYNPDNPYSAGVAGTSSTSSHDALVGVAMPLTRSTTFLASYIRKDDRDPANRDANQLAVGASYVVSRKTDFYAALSHTITTNGTGILINGAARPSGSYGINVGMRHSF